MLSYLDQLKAAADARGYTLLAALAAAGESTSFYYRWSRPNDWGPSLGTARRVLAGIEALPPQPGALPVASALPPHAVAVATVRKLPRDWLDFLRQLAEARHDIDLPSRKLDERIGTADGLVSKWECGERRPNGFNLWCWAEALGGVLAFVRIDNGKVARPTGEVSKQAGDGGRDPVRQHGRGEALADAPAR